MIRTQANKPVLSKHNGKWSATFDNFRGTPGDEYLMSTVESAAVFVTEEEAYAGTERALAVLEATGKYPNMCGPF
jgi:hypothetical protein